MKTYLQIFCAVITGILVCFSFPTVLFGWHAPSMGIIGYVALVPLFVAVHKVLPRKAFVLTFVSALVWYGGSLYWVFRAMHTYGKLPALSSALITVLLVVVVSAYIALAPMLTRFIIRNGKGETLLVLPALWVAMEFCRNYLPCNGFPWSNVAMSQYQLLTPLQICDITGVYGLIFVIVWINQFVAEIFLRLKGEHITHLRSKSVTTAILLIIIIIYGAVRLKTLPESYAAAQAVKVGMIQGNIDQGEKWDESKAIDNLNIHRLSARRLRNAPVDLIIWPEAAYPWFFPTQIASINPLRLGFSDMEMTRYPYTLMGAVSEEPTGDLHNSAFLFDSHGRFEGEYHKAHLVPFGEYIPYKKLFFFAKKLTAPVGNFIGGSSYEPLSFGARLVGILICYEDIFPEISRKTVAAGAEFLANLTNDAWYGVSSAPYQHLALSVFRAVENRRYLVRATNSGVSAVIEPSGRIVMQSGIFERAIMVAAIAPLTKLSTYTRLGDWFAWGCIVYAAFMIAMCFFAGFNKIRSTKSEILNKSQ